MSNRSSTSATAASEKPSLLRQWINAHDSSSLPLDDEDFEILLKNNITVENFCDRLKSDERMKEMGFVIGTRIALRNIREHILQEESPEVDLATNAKDRQLASGPRAGVVLRENELSLLLDSSFTMAELQMAQSKLRKVSSSPSSGSTAIASYSSCSICGSSTASLTKILADPCLFDSGEVSWFNSSSNYVSLCAPCRTLFSNFEVSMVPLSHPGEILKFVVIVNGDSARKPSSRLRPKSNPKKELRLVDLEAQSAPHLLNENDQLIPPIQTESGRYWCPYCPEKTRHAFVSFGNAVSHYGKCFYFKSLLKDIGITVDYRDSTCPYCHQRFSQVHAHYPRCNKFVELVKSTEQARLIARASAGAPVNGQVVEQPSVESNVLQLKLLRLHAMFSFLKTKMTTTSSVIEFVTDQMEFAPGYTVVPKTKTSYEKEKLSIPLPRSKSSLCYRGK